MGTPSIESPWDPWGGHGDPMGTPPRGPQGVQRGAAGVPLGCPAVLGRGAVSGPSALAFLGGVQRLSNVLEGVRTFWKMPAPFGICSNVSQGARTFWAAFECCPTCLELFSWQVVGGASNMFRLLADCPRCLELFQVDGRWSEVPRAYSCTLCYLLYLFHKIYPRGPCGVLRTPQGSHEGSHGIPRGAPGIPRMYPM